MADATTSDELEAQGDAAVEVENPTVVQTETVWLRHHTGVAHNVNVGSEAHRRLVADGAQPTEPTDKDTEVTDFAMLEKAKADKKSR